MLFLANLLPGEWWKDPKIVHIKCLFFCFLNVNGLQHFSCRLLYWDMIWNEILNLKRVCYTEMSENIPQPPPPPMIPHTPSQVPIPPKITRQTTFVTQISSTEDIRLAMYERLKKNVYVLGSTWNNVIHLL